MKEKYILTDEKIEHYGRTLYRIKAIRDFGNVKNGDLGGFIENEENLSYYDNCWIYDNAKIYDNAGIYGDAKIYDNVDVFDNAKVYGNAEISGDVEVFGSAEVFGNAKVYGNAEISGNVEVFGNVIISDNVILWKNAFIYEPNDYISFVNVGRRNDTLYAYRTKEGFVIQVGCFFGTIDEFIKEVKETHGDNKFAKEYFAIAEIIRDRFINK